MLPSPALEVKCVTRGGMSGGPVFDSNGLLIGVHSSGFQDDWPSYITLIWPALAHRLIGGWPTGFMKTSQALVEMDPRICSIDDRSAISFVQQDDGRITIAYKSWE